jgi:Holliday junction resolvasome RuvABC endonuclease subunit
VKVAGVDFSTKGFDVVTVPLMGRIRMEWFRGVLVEAGGAFRAAELVRGELDEAVSWKGVSVVYLEKPFSQSGATIAGLSLIEGAILASLPEGIVANEIPAQEWKRLLLGKPSASKEEVEQHLRGLGLGELPDEHAWDALGIACAARRELRDAGDRLRDAERSAA